VRHRAGDGDGIPPSIPAGQAPGGLVFRAYTLDRAEQVLLTEVALLADTWREAYTTNPTLPPGVGHNERFMWVAYDGDSGQLRGRLVARRVDRTSNLVIEARWQ
jgi:hypothetical protein